MNIRRLIFTAKQYCRYAYVSKSKFRIHSPFVFQFVLQVLEAKKNDALVQQLKQLIVTHYPQIQPSTFGAGSSANQTGQTMPTKKLISTIATRPKYGKILTAVANYIKAKNVLELGAGLGIGTAYLAASKSVEQIVSIEANESFYKINTQLFNELQQHKVQFKLGTIEQLLPETLVAMQPIDLVFIDGNHTKEATLKYYHAVLPYLSVNAVVIFDDIYWSEEMTEAWQTIVADNAHRLSIDIFQHGMVFMNDKNKQKESFTLWY